MAKQPRILAGKTAAITGGARGIGRATAEAFQRHGMRVAIGDVDLEAARKTAAELGPTAVGLALDVTDSVSFVAFLDHAEAQLGPIDVLVNNAGIMPIGPFLEEDDATARRILDINVHGVINGMKAVLPRMRARGCGHVVNIASQAGKYGFPGGATYCASKAAVINLSRAVRKELRGSGVELSVISPVAVNTELGLGLSEPRQRQFRKIEPRQVADAIVQALQVPKFDVHVPKQLDLSQRINGLLPIGAQDALSRVSGADAVLSQVDTGARAGYELRAARSEPALAAGREVAALEPPAEPAPEPGEGEPALDPVPERQRITQTAGD
ncbi:MAG TPA: SDR family oxidoreductase [Solirubrobacteraceae bacterium]|nr:SDR family oxidoreductase [Solirubrobacteraceae bacterium]HLM86176.1 SDR family oxidoreductase [Solirubrobacteraceae bacterium]